MCRNIHTLYNFEPPATSEEIHDASLQYVRKISGFTKPSQANEQAFALAVDEIAAASKRLLDREKRGQWVYYRVNRARLEELRGLLTTRPPRARAAKRYATA